jgi:DNA-binding transcriptional ArsR family regulator
MRLSLEDEVARVTAIAHPQRYRIIAALMEEPRHVSGLARHLGISRPLLYVHLQRLEAVGYLTGRLELSDDGKALKYFEVVPFTITLSPAAIVAVVGSQPDLEIHPTKESSD